MRFATRWIAPVALLAILFAEGTVGWARSPVLPIPSPREASSTLSPKSGVSKSPFLAPKSKGGKKKSWFPFGNRNNKGHSR
jgi:hypothetical protein